jgi:L-ribulose-5-phosphate 3-epimerase
MDLIINSKFFAQYTPEELGKKALELGYDGIDLCVRPGHPIHADNVTQALPEAMKVWRHQGVTCPMVTAPVTLVDPQSPEMENYYIACAEAEILRLKIGFWKYEAGDEYWQTLDAARRDLALIVKLGEKYGIQTCYQIHSGPCIGSNCAGLMHLIKDFDPKYVGAYPDFGHIALDGEDPAMGLAMIKDHLSVVGVKDAYYKARAPGQTPRYRPCFTKMGEGCVDWHQCFGLLHKMQFEGPISVHTEYEFDETIIRQVGYAQTAPPNVEQWAKEDAIYLRQILADVQKNNM